MEPQDRYQPNSRNMKELVTLINSLFAKNTTLAALQSNVLLLASAKAGEVVLNTSSEQTITFSSPYSVKPVMVYSFEEAADNQPVIVKTKSFVMGTGANAGKWVGAIVRGYRMQKLPAQSTISLTSLLTGVVTGLNNLLTSLGLYNVAGGSASGVTVQWTSRIPA